MKKTFFIIALSGAAAAVLLFTMGRTALRSHLKQQKTVTIKAQERPDICARNGALLISNKKRTQNTQRLRYAAIDGKFAAGLLGFTQLQNGREAGQSGIESLIDRRKTPGRPVCLALDCKIQHNLENMVSHIAENWKPDFVYCVSILSTGELTGAAQRPVLDINDRGKVDGGMIFFPAEYIFSVPEKWMNLLNSSSYLPAAEREKFGFHKKLNVFTTEAVGKLSYYPSDSDPQFKSDQTATVLHYLLAYIGTAEKKTIPQLQLFSTGKLSPVLPAGKTRWIIITQTDKPDKSLLALAEFPASCGGKNYTLLRCSWGRNQNIDTAPAAEWLKNFQFKQY